MNESKRKSFLGWIVLAPLVFYLGAYVVYRFTGNADFYDPSDDISAMDNPGLNRPAFRISVTTPQQRFFASFFQPCIAAEDFYQQRQRHP